MADSARRLGALAVAAAVAAACGNSQPTGAPRPASISPDRGSQVVPVPVRIRGDGFDAEVSADFTSAGPGGVAVDARFQALLGDTPLDDVALQRDGTIAATVPVGIAPGRYDLTVIGPGGRSGRLAQAYQVVGYGAFAATVAGFRVETAGAPVAARPFTVVVTALDAAGAVVPDFAGSVALSDLTGTTVPARVGLFTAGRWTGAVEIRGAHAADVLTAAGPGGATGRSAPFAVAPAPAAAVRFDTPALSVAAGECAGPLALSLADEFGQPTTAAAATPLAVAAAPAAGITLFSDGTCTVPAATGVTVPAGSDAVAFSFTATAAGPLVLSATPAALPAVSQTETIVPGRAARLAFLTGSQTVEAGRCSGPVTLEALDAYGNPAAVSTTAASPVVLGGTDLTFSSGSGCAGGAVAFAPGATTATFSFRRSVPGTGRVAITATAGTAGGTQDETIVAGPAVRLAFTTAPQTVAGGACSGDAVVEGRDAAGNATAPSITGATSVSLSGAALTFFAGAGCSGGAVSQASIPAGATAATFSFRRTVPGTGAVDVTAAATGLASAVQTESIVAGAAARLAFTTAPQTVPAGLCSGTATLEARDAAGNPVPASASADTPVTLTGAGLAFFAGGGCTGGAVSVAAGATTATLSFRRTVPGTGAVDVTASAGALAPAVQTETISLGDPSQLAFVTAPQTVRAAECSADLAVEARDAAGNPVTPSGTAATPVELTGASLTFFAGSGCAGAPVTAAQIPAAATGATFSFRRTVPGTGAVDVTASAGALAVAVQTETIALGAASQLAFTTPARTVQAGDCSTDVTVAAQDGAGNAVTVPAATVVGLAGGTLTFHAGSACAGAGVAQVSIPAGSGAVTWSFRGTAAGAVAVMASASGLGAAAQTQTVDPAALDHFSWAAVASPQPVGSPFAVTVSARDAFGNLAAFAGTAALSASSGSVSCSTSCSAAAATAPFVAGQWSGAVTIAAAVAGVTLTAAASTWTGTSNAFDVQDLWAARSPPSASFTVSQRVVVSGNTLAFDASASSDRQTAAAALEVSWGFEAATAADFASTVAPPSAPWTAWTTTKTAYHAFINNGTSVLVVRPRLAVRDGEAGPGGPDVGYADGLVVVLPSGSDLCVVNTSSLVDDGANACAGPGPDGKLSLTEAVRLARTWPGTLNITFSDPMTIASTTGATLTLDHAARIIGTPGVVLDGVSLDLAADDILVTGLEFAHLATPITVRNQIVSDVQLEDLVVRDGAGVQVTDGHARLRNVRMRGCAGTCVRETGPGAFLGIFASDFQGAGGDVGVTVDSCAAAATGAGSSPYEPWSAIGWSGTGSAFVGTSVFTGFATAVSLPSAGSCITPVLRFVTFDGNGTGVRRDASLGASGELTDALFTRQTAAAVDPLACGFLTIARIAAWSNASAACLSPDLTGDPLYIWAAGRDFRLQYSSPLKDAGGTASSVELDGAGPGRYLGAAPDRGGRETY